MRGVRRSIYTYTACLRSHIVPLLSSLYIIAHPDPFSACQIYAKSQQIQVFT